MDVILPAHLILVALTLLSGLVWAGLGVLESIAAWVGWRREE